MTAFLLPNQTSTANEAGSCFVSYSKLLKLFTGIDIVKKKKENRKQTWSMTAIPGCQIRQAQQVKLDPSLLLRLAVTVILLAHLSTYFV